jgi:TctA family transporter
MLSLGSLLIFVQLPIAAFLLLLVTVSLVLPFFHTHILTEERAS